MISSKQVDSLYYRVAWNLNPSMEHLLSKVASFCPAQSPRSQLTQQASFHDATRASIRRFIPSIYIHLLCEWVKATALQATKIFFSSLQLYPSPSMSQLSIELSAPNGRTWSQPTGLFIDNEFVESKKGEKLVTIDPAYARLIVHISRNRHG